MRTTLDTRIASRLCFSPRWLPWALLFLASCEGQRQEAPEPPVAPAAPAVDRDSFAGTWRTTFGTMMLTAEKDQLHGGYAMPQIGVGLLEGTVAERKFTFRYREPAVSGEGEFELAADGLSFTGKWRPEGTETWHEWTGTRVLETRTDATFGGVWDTSLGAMRLLSEGDAVRGVYGAGAAYTLEGKTSGRTLQFTYREGQVRGEGAFTLSADGELFYGRWREEGDTQWHPWLGGRQPGSPGRVWLVVLEANWERNLAEAEYTFGGMLKAFFARSPKVQVRQRVFHDAASLRRWLGEVTYLTEPVVICIASHGSDEGLTVDGQTIGPDVLADGLHRADNVKLVHFSSCQIMAGDMPARIQAQLDPKARFPISGYKRAADWAGSAVLEFMYFDLVLDRGLEPKEAAEQVRKLIGFAGERPAPGSVIPPAGFTILLPQAPQPVAGH